MSPRQDQQESTRAEQASFDLWLRRGLKERWGRVAKEPIPEDLLALLDEDATRH